MAPAASVATVVAQNETGQPSELTRALVTSHEQYRQHMQQNKQNNDIRSNRVQITDQPAVGDFIHDDGYTGKGLFRIGNVVNQQQQPGEKLQTEQSQQNRPQGVPDIDVTRQQIAAQIAVQQLANAKTPIQPIDSFFR